MRVFNVVLICPVFHLMRLAMNVCIGFMAAVPPTKIFLKIKKSARPYARSDFRIIL